MPYRPPDIERALLHKFNFEQDTQRGVDHRRFVLHREGLPSIRTKVSHNRAPIGPALESAICRQLHVRHPFFHGMIDCTKSREDYYQQVRDDPFPPFPQR